ncbi:MAG: ATP-dependent RecD-like DNA helicase [Syntrophaceae bacterium]
MTDRETTTRRPGETGETMETLTGPIERVTFYARESGYTVARISVPGQVGTVTVVGHLINPGVGQWYDFTGTWVSHPRYGPQFQVREFAARAPVTEEGIRTYLSSGIIRNIGTELASRIVDSFGMDTFRVISEEPHRLCEVDGIGKVRAEAIRNAWKEHEGIRDIMVFLYSHGITGLAARIFKRYGDDTVEVVRENPFRLALEIPGIGFQTADRIAQRLGVPSDSPGRIHAGIMYVLETMAMQGHVYVPRGLLVRLGMEQLGVRKEALDQGIAGLRASGGVMVEQLNHGREDEDAVYKPALLKAEQCCAEKLLLLCNARKRVGDMDSGKAIAWVQRNLGITLSGSQEDAVRCACENSCMVLTGGPGTGKTTVLAAIFKMFAWGHTDVLLAAPTGRAAKRMSEATGAEAKTIHRLLEYNPTTDRFMRNGDNELKADLLIVDEASMVDILLLEHLLEAVPLGTTVIFVGDVDQLPSVGPGNVLRDMLDSGKVPVVRLDTIFRQALRSRIVVNSHRINHGKMPEVSGEAESDYVFIREEAPEAVLRRVIDMVAHEIPARYGLNPFTQIQVLSPMHKGVLGVENLNRELQKALNPCGRVFMKGGREYRIGDKVMQTRNNYELEVFNGDIGILTKVDEEEGKAMVSYDGRLVTYRDPEGLEDVILSYATTIHKAQGSEYQAVVIPLGTQHFVMLQRNLLYTAVTRGKRLVVMLGSERAVEIAGKNSRTRMRHSLFARRLSEGV